MSFLSEMAQSYTKAKGGAWTIKKLNSEWDNLIDEGYQFTRFEGSTPGIESNHKLDVLFRDFNTNKNISLEFKNWANVNTISTEVGSQFRAYLESGHSFNYYFNGNTQEMKNIFQNIFENLKKAQELFDLNPFLFESKGIVSKERLNQLAINNELINHPVLDFIK